MCVCVCLYLSVTFVTIDGIFATIKHVTNGICRFQHSPSKYVNEKIVFRELDVLKSEGGIRRFWHLPSNLINAKIAISDLDLLFGSRYFTIGISNQNQITFVSESPGTVSFAAHPQGRLVSVRRVGSAESDRSLMIVVGDVRRECLDAISECLDGCRGTCEWWQPVPDMWCRWGEGIQRDQCLGSGLGQQVLPGRPQCPRRSVVVDTTTPETVVAGVAGPWRSSSPLCRRCAGWWAASVMDVEVSL